MSIVPRHRLLFWFAWVVLPFSALGAVHPESTLVALVLIGFLLAIALADALFGAGRLEGIEVRLPETVRFSRDRAGMLAVAITKPQQQSIVLRLGFSYPAEISTAQEVQDVLLPAGSERFCINWSCTPRKRGNYRLERVYLETASRLGFWGIRDSLPVRCEIRVYPNLLAERRSLAALFLNRGLFGFHAQRQVGKGREFEKLREYSPGDSYEEIHWKTTAKRGRPVTKVFQIEKTQEVYVIIDASRLGAREIGPPRTISPGASLNSSEPPQTILERFITAALVLGLAAERQGDLFGLVAFSEQVERFVRAKSGRQHFSSCRDAIYMLEPRGVSPDFDEIATFIRLRLRRRALLVILTSLDDPVLAESFVRNMELLSRQHLILVSMLKPPGADPLFTDSSVNSPDDLYRQLAGHLRWHDLRELEKVLQRRGVAFSLLSNERLTVDLVTQYLNVKRRQLI